MRPFYIFTVWFQLFFINRSTADLVTDFFDRIARAFNKPRVTQAVACNIFQAFLRFYHAGFLYKLSSYQISVRVFGKAFSFLGDRQFWIVLDGKCLQEYPVNPGFP